MKSVLILLVVSFLFGTLSFAAMDDPAGKKVFADKKCTTCHTVEDQGITLEVKKDNIRDLSNAGKVGDVAFISGYLKKSEKINDKAHPMAFRGTDEELNALAEWLASLKKEVEEVEEAEETE